MTTRSIQCVFVGVLGFLCLSRADEVQAQAPFNTHELLKDAQGKARLIIEVESVFELLPLHGFAPVRVKVTNKREDEPEWTFRFDGLGGDHRFASEFTFKVRKNKPDIHQFMVPMPTDFNTAGFSFGRKLTYTAKADGYQVLEGEVNDSFPYDWPSIGISVSLARGNLEFLKQERHTAIAASSHTGNGDAFGGMFEPNSLPWDWRGYSGLDALMLTDKEWQDLLAGQPSICKAILDWNRLGGRLDIYTDQGLSAYALGIPEVKDGRRSLGVVNVVPWDGNSLDPLKTVASYGSARQQRSVIVDQPAQFDGLMAMFGKRAFGNWQVAVILILFGVLVGPVNLLVLAKPGQRHRLFFTTPLISLGASLLLVLLILFQDGTGGAGARTVVVNIEPSDTSAYVSQFQASRTGVLFSGAFKAPNSYATMCAMQAGPWAAVIADGNEAMRYNLDGDVFGGDWFQSRRELAHHLKSIRSTRARIELAPQQGDAPTIVSSLGFDLKILFYTDAQGANWKAPSVVETGKRVTLEKTDGREWEPFVGTNSTWVSKDALSQKNSFVALADSAPEFAIETHKGIRWQDHVIVIGPVIGAEQNE